MRRIILLALLNFCASAMMAHGGHMATFKYQITSDQIVLEFNIENEVLDHFDLEKSCENYKVTTALCLLQYINKNAILKIEEEQVTFELLSSQKGEHFFTLKMIAKGDFSESQTIWIKNTCFLKFDRRFENRIMIQKEDFEKSYRLNRKNKKLTIDT